MLEATIPEYDVNTHIKAAYNDKLPTAIKTGTTIAGMLFKDGVILGADTRSTAGSIVADKDCMKIHRLAKNIYCCGAGTAADTDHITRMVESELEYFHCLESNLEEASFVIAKTKLKRHLYQYQGHVQAALVIGGYDETGPHLCSIDPHGSSHVLPYTTMGSGSLAAMSVFESRYKANMTEEEGKKLVRDSIAAGVFNDLGSGSNIDLCIIKKGKVDIIKPYELANVRGVRQGKYRPPNGTTAVLSTKKIPIEVVSTTYLPVEREVEPMEE